MKTGNSRKKLNALDPKLIAESVTNAVQSSSGSKPSTFSNHSGQKSFKPTQFYGKQKEPELAPRVDGSLKPDVNCNYCKDLGHMKFNCPKLKKKEARMAGSQSQQFKNGNKMGSDRRIHGPALTLKRIPLNLS